MLRVDYNLLPSIWGVLRRSWPTNSKFCATMLHEMLLNLHEMLLQTQPDLNTFQVNPVTHQVTRIIVFSWESANMWSMLSTAFSRHFPRYTWFQQTGACRMKESSGEAQSVLGFRITDSRAGIRWFTPVQWPWLWNVVSVMGHSNMIEALLGSLGPF
ncbi:hypothetical protein JCM33374_g3192 [Metschnikowia sp. JCM 33374]|nr:hypothetical protein JCM33374_g3192 [Metschnikowia sp. JCM 33374]